MVTLGGTRTERHRFDETAIVLQWSQQRIFVKISGPLMSALHNAVGYNLCAGNVNDFFTRVSVQNTVVNLDISTFIVNRTTGARCIVAERGVDQANRTTTINCKEFTVEQSASIHGCCISTEGHIGQE